MREVPKVTRWRGAGPIGLARARTVTIPQGPSPAARVDKQRGRPSAIRGPTVISSRQVRLDARTLHRRSSAPSLTH